MFPVNQKKPAISAAVRADDGKWFRARGWKVWQTRRPSDGELCRMFEQTDLPVDGLAVIPGPVSWELCVRDFDQPDGYRDWARANPDLAGRLPTARTGRGFHVYFRLPYRHAPVYRKFGDGELIGDGKHYVVLPPSSHPSGMTYEWIANRPFQRSDLPRLHPSVFLPSQPAPSGQGRSTHLLSTSSVTQESVREFSGVEEVVTACLPAGPGERNDCLWRLARALKSVPELVNAWKSAPHCADATDADLWPVFERWFDSAQSVIGTKSCKASWKDFRRQWELARVPMGHGFRNAVAEALGGPFPAESARFKDEPTRRLAAVCAALQRYAGADPFFLSCRTAAEVCGFTNHMTANRRLGTFVKTELLELVERGIPGKENRRASRYRWRGEEEDTSVTVDPRNREQVPAGA